MRRSASVFPIPSKIRMREINLNSIPVLVTGAAGFIGSNLVARLLRDLEGANIVGIDNLNDYYSPSLKSYRLKILDEEARRSSSSWRFMLGNIADKSFIDDLFSDYSFAVVVNLAAQAGVRYGMENPYAYVESNLVGFVNILEACRHSYDGGKKGVEHLVYASSSSVYGGSKKIPFRVGDPVDEPVSLYAATKKSNELLAHSYAKLYDIPTTGLRFFTVYGPAGRPDMLYYSAAEKFARGETVKLFNYGNCRRDFTYVDDVVEGVVRVMRSAPSRRRGDDGLPIAPAALYNIGGGRPENLLEFMTVLQEELVDAGVLPADYDFNARRELVPMQPGDVFETYADSRPLERDFGFTPQTTIREGLRQFARWFKEYRAESESAKEE